MNRSLQPVDVSSGSVLSVLRTLIPSGPVRYRAALDLAERAAARLLQLYAIEAAPVPAELVSGLPRIYVQTDRFLPSMTSGLSVWDSRLASWVITLNGREPTTRQRFTTLHEFFHILVHRQVARAGLFTELKPEQVEYIADYFAGCVLVPKRLLKQAWGSGVQDPARLGELFGVSSRAAEVRLAQVRLAVTDTEPSTGNEPAMGISR